MVKATSLLAALVVVSFLSADAQPVCSKDLCCEDKPKTLCKNGGTDGAAFAAADCPDGKKAIFMNGVCAAAKCTATECCFVQNCDLFLDEPHAIPGGQGGACPETKIFKENKCAAAKCTVDECCADKPKEEAEPKKPKFSCKRTVKEGGFPGDKACDTQTKGNLKHSIAALGMHSFGATAADGGCEKKQCIAGECCFAFCQDREGKTDGPPAKGEGYCDKDKQDYTPMGICLGKGLVDKLEESGVSSLQPGMMIAAVVAVMMGLFQ